MAGAKGYCSQDATVRLARAALHQWEEPPISGWKGSGTVFFSGCPLHCVYCQNYQIANGDVGKPVSLERLSEIFIELQEKGAHNINLVTPTHYAPQIASALSHARNTELNIPIVCNTSGYEAESLNYFRGLIDIYLTDFKYSSPEVAKRYSKAEDYPYVALNALDEMFSQVGPVVIDGEAGLMKRGVIVRHLLLPNNLRDSFGVMRLLASKPYSKDIIVSLMSQYTPLDNKDLMDFPELQEQVSEEDYQALIDYALALGLENSYCQDGEAAQESFIPAFDYEGI